MTTEELRNTPEYIAEAAKILAAKDHGKLATASRNTKHVAKEAGDAIGWILTGIFVLCICLAAYCKIFL